MKKPLVGAGIVFLALWAVLGSIFVFKSGNINSAVERSGSTTAPATKAGDGVPQEAEKVVAKASNPEPATRAVMTQEQVAKMMKDPCFLRLQDVSGGLLLYYATHEKTFPKSLEDLRVYMKAQTGRDFLIACPTSGLPYVYGGGSQVEGQKWILFVYDAEASHDGVRLGIVGSPEADGRPMTLRVIPVDDKMLEGTMPSRPVHP